MACVDSFGVIHSINMVEIEPKPGTLATVCGIKCAPDSSVGYSRIDCGNCRQKINKYYIDSYWRYWGVW